MKLLAADLVATGQLRVGLSLEEIADTIWATNSPELFLLFSRDRGWTEERYVHWLIDCWCRLLLEP